MAKVRMYSPPARKPVRAYSKGRWLKQRPIGRGHGPTDDHGGTDAPLVATGATAGIPGTYTPAGSQLPANLGALVGITASPASAWTKGQYVVLGDASEAHWNGGSWGAGRRP